MSDIPHITWHADGLLFIEAKMAAKRSVKMLDRLGEQSEAMTAIILCVVVAESSINAICDWFEVHHLRPPFSIPHSLPYGFDKLELRTKWSMFPLLVRNRSFDRGAEPWQSFQALVELRNYIVHLQRRVLPKNAAALLKAKKLIEESDFPSFKVAWWACETLADMFVKLTELIDPPKNWIDCGSWQWTPKYFPHGLSTPGDPWDPSMIPPRHTWPPELDPTWQWNKRENGGGAAQADSHKYTAPKADRRAQTEHEPNRYPAQKSE